MQAPYPEQSQGYGQPQPYYQPQPYAPPPQPYEQAPISQPIYEKPYDNSSPIIDEYKPEDHSSEHFGFLQKVYGIVTVQLIITFSMCMIASLSSSFQKILIMPVIFYGSIVGFIVFIIMAMFVKNRVPINYVCLFGFTICMSVMVAAIASFVDPADVFKAILTTVVISTGLTILVIIMGTNIIIWILILEVIVISLIFLLVFSFIFTFSLLYTLYIPLVGLLYGIYLVIDTCIIHDFADEEDYIIAAMIIYIDIIYIFILILSIFGGKK